MTGDWIGLSRLGEKEAILRGRAEKNWVFIVFSLLIMSQGVQLMYFTTQHKIVTLSDCLVVSFQNTQICIDMLIPLFFILRSKTMMKNETLIRSGGIKRLWSGIFLRAILWAAEILMMLILVVLVLGIALSNGIANWVDSDSFFAMWNGGTLTENPEFIQLLFLYIMLMYPRILLAENITALGYWCFGNYWVGYLAVGIVFWMPAFPGTDWGMAALGLNYSDFMHTGGFYSMHFWKIKVLLTASVVIYYVGLIWKKRDFLISS